MIMPTQDSDWSGRAKENESIYPRMAGLQHPTTNFILTNTSNVQKVLVWLTNLGHFLVIFNFYWKKWNTNQTSPLIELM